MCEPLRRKIRKDCIPQCCINGEINRLTFLKFDVKSAVQFYKRYACGLNEDGQILLSKEQPELWRHYEEYNREQCKKYPYLINTSPEWRYDKWLFNYCFQDAIE